MPTEGKDKEAKVIPIGVQNQFYSGLGDYAEKSLSLLDPNNVDSSETWREEIKALLDSNILKGLFFTEDWVFITVDLVANKLSSQPLQIVKRKFEDGKEIIEPDMEHPLNMLIDQPNPWQDYHSWMYNTVVEITLMGNGVIWNAPRAGFLITLPADNVTVDFNTKGEIENYILTTFKEEVSGMSAAQAEAAFKQKEIIHIRKPNPNSLLWGLSPFVPGRKSVLFNRYSSDYLNAFYLRQATPGLPLSLDRQVNEDVALRQLRSFEVAYQGRKNMRRTLILPKGVKAEPLTHSLADQKLIDHINTNRETICGLLKVPKHELGLQEAGSLGSEEHKVALRNFWEATLKPTARLIEGALDKHFRAQLGEDHFFRFDFDDVPALKDDLESKAKTATQMLQAGLTLNEVRTRVWEIEAIEDPSADQPFVLVQQRASAINITPQPEQVEEEKKLKVQGPKIEQFRAQAVKQLDEEESRKINQLASIAIETLTAMTLSAVDEVEDELKKSAQKAYKQDEPSKRALRRRITRALDEFEESWVTDVARTLTSSVDTGYDAQLEFIFNAQARREIQALKERDEEKRRLTLEARGLRSFADISKTHTERIMREVTDSVDKGESITQTIRRVASSLGTPSQLAGKAETIARTETLTAVSIGQSAAADNAAEVIPGLKKAWLTAGDDRVRDSHQRLDGDVVDMNEKFDNGLRFPRDPTAGDAAEVINCRCTLLLVPPDEDLL